MRRWRPLLALAFLPLIGCGGGERIDGAGATFVEPIMKEWTYKFNERNGTRIGYQGTGSGDGIDQVISNTVDFGCSDAPMKQEQLDRAKEAGGDVIHAPLIMGAVAVVYNLPGVEDLKLSGPVIADIYLGKITEWNDKAIADLNQNLLLPKLGISPVIRSDSSGTSAIFTEFLSKTSDEFKTTVGTSKTPTLPEGVGTGKPKNSGIAGQVKNFEGTIGYVNLNYAAEGGLSTAKIRNAAGEFVAPDPDAVSAAAAAAMQSEQTDEPYSLHALTYSLTNADGAKSYPIAGMSYAILYQNMPAEKGKTVVEFLKWCVTEGQDSAERLHYAPLPEDLRDKVVEKLESVTFQE